MLETGTIPLVAELTNKPGFLQLPSQIPLVYWHIIYQSGTLAVGHNCSNRGRSRGCRRVCDTRLEQRLEGLMTDIVQGAAPTAGRVSDAYRWTQLTIGVAAMVMIANYQYGWTFFVPDIQKTFGWDRASIQWAFTLFVLFETWLVPVEGWFVDKYGPRVVVLVGGILCAIGWAINAQATTLNGFYLGMIIAGIGAGGVYGTCVGNALKWFPDKRGLAAGITAAGFGAGSALTVAPIQAMIKDSGFQATFLYFGLGQGIIIVIL